MTCIEFYSKGSGYQMTMETETTVNGTEAKPSACLECAETRAMVADLQSKLDEMITIVGEIKDAVGPTLTAFQNSPVAKMLGVGQ